MDAAHKKYLDNQLKELEYYFLLVNGRLSDRSFKLGLTYYDVIENYGTDLFLYTFLDKSMARIAESVYKNPTCKTCHVVNYNPDEKEFYICEYEVWKPARKEYVTKQVFEQILILLSVFRVKNRPQLAEFLKQHNSELRSMLWFDELMSSDSYAFKQAREKELLIIDTILTLQ